MNDQPAQTAEEKEAERLRKWREERAIQADKDKQERIKVAKEKRAQELAAEENESKTAAAALLPNPESLRLAKIKIRKRNRRAKAGFILQILLFVLVPTGLVIGYLNQYAVPLYEARSVVSIAKPARDNNPGLTGLLGAVGGANSNMNEAFLAQAYIESLALMESLEAELGLVTFFSSPALDPYTRLRDIPQLSVSKTNGFRYFVFSSINIQTGLLTLYVRAPEPNMAINISEVALTLTAEHINGLSEKLYQHRTSLARQSVTDARLALTEAQAELTQLQIASGEANPVIRVEGVYATIGKLESEIVELNTEIQRAGVAGQRDDLMTQRLVTLRENIQSLIVEQRALLIEAPENGGRSLNQLLLDYELALLQVRIAEETLSATLLALANASDEAALAQSQFLIVVPPKTTEFANLPNIPKTGFVAFLVFLSLMSLFRLLPSARKN